jgi:hypothetical protein
MKTFVAAVLAVVLGTSAFAADEKPVCQDPVPEKKKDAVDEAKFDWHKVMGKTKEEAVKMIEDNGWQAVIVMEDGKALVSKQPENEGKPCLDLIIAKGKVCGAVLAGWDNQPKDAKGKAK